MVNPRLTNTKTWGGMSGPPKPIPIPSMVYSPIIRLNLLVFSCRWIYRSSHGSVMGYPHIPGDLDDGREWHSERLIPSPLSLPTFAMGIWSCVPREGQNTRCCPYQLEMGLCLFISTLRIMGSQNWWFGDPRPLLYTSKPLYSRVQWFLG